MTPHNHYKTTAICRPRSLEVVAQKDGWGGGSCNYLPSQNTSHRRVRVSCVPIISQENILMFLIPHNIKFIIYKITMYF